MSCLYPGRSDTRASRPVSSQLLRRVPSIQLPNKKKKTEKKKKKSYSLPDPPRTRASRARKVCRIYMAGMKRMICQACLCQHSLCQETSKLVVDHMQTPAGVVCMSNMWQGFWNPGPHIQRVRIVMVIADNRLTTVANRRCTRHAVPGPARNSAVVVAGGYHPWCSSRMSGTRVC